MKFVIFTTVALLTFFQTNGQEHQEVLPENKDSSKIKSVKDFFQKSEWHFHSRSYFMATLNEGVLKDDYTFAQGAGIGLLTVPVKGFQLGVKGYFIFNVASSNLSKPDPTTLLGNRYEIGQYDVTNPTNHKDLDRLEDLFLRYTFRHSSITIGRMELETPFMNMQDGRMRPTLEEGTWLKLKLSEKIQFEGGYIWSVSPRSTVEWYSLKESIGIYGQGVNSKGKPSNYLDHIDAGGLFLGNLKLKLTKGLSFNIWNAYFEKIMNTALIEIKNENQLNSFNFYQGVMFFHQNAIGNGGNENQNITYIEKGSEANVISARVGLKTKKINWNVNFTHITNHGRYLMPREWGRDYFYTFMPRERNEGAGNLNAFTTNFLIGSEADKLKAGIGYGYYKMPSVTDFKFNKYGMPAYHQLNVSAQYSFANFWKGLNIRFLVAAKKQDGNEVLNPKFIYNKVNMANFNFIVDLKL